MTVLQGVLAGAGLVAVLMGLIWRMFVHFDAKNESRFEQLDAKSDRLDAKNESRFEQLDAKSDRLDAKNESRFEQLDAKNESRFEQLDAKNESRFEQLDAKSDRLDAKNESRFDRLDAKNERAHAAITENIKAVDDRAEQRSEAQRATLESIARDVSFLAGRQAERDRQAERAGGKDRSEDRSV